MGTGRETTMDATILPGPGTEAPRAATRAKRRPPQHPVGRPGAVSAGNHRRGRRRGDADRSVANRTGLNISTCHHLLATLIKRGFAAKVPGRRLYALGSRIHLSRPRLPAGRSAAPRAALSGDHQPGDRRDRASGGAAGRRGGDARGARGAPRRARRHRQDRQAGSARTPPRSARPSSPGCRRTRCGASSATA